MPKAPRRFINMQAKETPPGSTVQPHGDSKVPDHVPGPKGVQPIPPAAPSDTPKDNIKWITLKCSKCLSALGFVHATGSEFNPVRCMNTDCRPTELQDTSLCAGSGQAAPNGIRVSPQACRVCDRPLRPEPNGNFPAHKPTPITERFM